MQALLNLPSVDQLQLTEAELEGVAGSPQYRLQIEWLKANGWAFTLTRAGRPVVGRLYANLKLANIDTAAMAPSTEWSPDLSALN
ncbi:DUF4224 domain-containing protein [Roseateles sp. MS654]|uniref:DUF4224 domain-containing protein n=1 Tax=Roseateles sp. MS654 TaxID=3412685 RepID=UPI003C2C62E1